MSQRVGQYANIVSPGNPPVLSFSTDEKVKRKEGGGRDVEELREK